jgi:hypothetical protein
MLCFLFIACSLQADKSQPSQPVSARAADLAAEKFPRDSVNLENASGFDDRRLFLSLGEALGALAVDINARKLFAILIINGNLPVTVLTAAIPGKAAGLGGLGLGLLLLQVW